MSADSPTKLNLVQFPTTLHFIEMFCLIFFCIIHPLNICYWAHTLCEELFLTLGKMKYLLPFSQMFLEDSTYLHIFFL